VILRHYLKVLRERWLIIVTSLVLALGAAAALWIVRPAQYTASLTLYVFAEQDSSNQNAFQGAQLSQQRVTSYVELVTSRRVMDAVITQMGLPLSADELSERVAASSTIDSVLINASVTDPDPARAARIADSVGRNFIAVVDEMERPADATSKPVVAVRIVQPATAPTKPSSAGLGLTLAIGALLGIAAGVALAALRHTLDNTVKSLDQVADITKSPSLGTIALDSAVRERPLTVHEDPNSPRAEAFRQIRTALQFIRIDQANKVFVTTSSLQGEGKTTTVANLSIALASAGDRVLAIEADLRRPTLTKVFGLENAIGLTSVLSRQVALDQAVQHWMGGVDVLGSGPLPPNPSELLASRSMAAIIAQLRPRYDVILVDTPPLLPVTDAAAVAPACDGAIFVCRFKKPSRDELQGACEALGAVSTPVLGTILTMVPRKGPHSYARYNSYYRSLDSASAESRRSPSRTPVNALHRAGGHRSSRAAIDRPQFNQR
jgi:capsular exopolysaccharide synthesis family protein